MSATATPVPMSLKIAAVGSGFAGAITSYGLHQIPGVEVVAFEKVAEHIGSTVGAGLNMNPNAIRCLNTLFPELAANFARIGYPRASVTSSKLNGDVLFTHQLVDSGLSDGVGQRVVWKDANKAMRSHIKDLLRFSSEVVSIEETSSCTRPVLLTIKDNKANRTYTEAFDFVFASDGRFSSLRTQMYGKAPAWYMGVANFRCLIPDTSGSMFDDLELIYNTSASAENLPVELRSNEIARYAFKAPPRMAVMRTRTMGQDVLYIFGNFAVPHKDKIPEALKCEAFVRALFTPADGKLSTKSAWLLEKLSSRADSLHWARFQDTEEHFFSDSKRVMFLGDSGKAFSPTLGLGAGAAVEQACMAVDQFLKSFVKYGGKNHSSLLHDFAERVTVAWRPRVNYIADISARAAMHLNPDSGFTFQDEMQAWQSSENEHMKAYQRLWKDYTRYQPFRQLKAQALAELESTSNHIASRL